MVDYSVGLEQTYVATIVLGVAFSLCGIAFALRLPPMRPAIRRSLAVAACIVLAPMLVSLTLMPIIYCMLNFVLQFDQILGSWRVELANGVLALRITTIILTFQFGKSLFKILTAALSPKGNRTRGSTVSANLLVAALFQYAFYLCAIIGLWFCAIENIHSIPATLASWSLFFIVDDSIVISDYAVHFSTPPLSRHVTRVVGFNIVIVALVAVALLESLSPLKYLLPIVQVGSMVASRYFFSWSRHTRSPRQYKQPTRNAWYLIAFPVIPFLLLWRLLCSIVSNLHARPK